MTCYIYTHNQQNEYPDIERYLEKNHLSADEIIEDAAPKKLHWTEREMGKLIKKMNKGDMLVVNEANNIACSTAQILEIFNILASRRIAVHFVKYNVILENNSDEVNSLHLMKLITRIETDFVSQRTTHALARRKAAGLPLGRPKGRKNKSLKLDVHKEEIAKYMKIGISKASIAKLVACHPQTLYDWLDRSEGRSEIHHS